MKRNKKGFTLIELLVVIAIIGILATIVLVSLNSARAKARDTRRISDLRQVALALEMYYDDSTTKNYPVLAVGTAGTVCTAATWTTMATALTGAATMTAVPVDPSNGATYYYAYGTEGNQTPQKYVLSARLETNNTALATDLDTATYGCACVDAAAAPYGPYCIQP